MATTITSSDLHAELTLLTRALKAPALCEALPQPLERARSDEWSHTQFLAAYMEREVTDRAAHGGELLVKAAKLPARKSLEEFDVSHASGTQTRPNRSPGNLGLHHP